MGRIIISVGRHAGANNVARRCLGKNGAAFVYLDPSGGSRCGHVRFRSSDNIQKEQAALLRALDSDGNDKKKRIKIPSAKAISKTGFGNDFKNKNNSNNKGKKLSMDEFFANLSKSKTKDASLAGRGSIGRQNADRPKSQEPSSIQAHHDTMERHLPTGLGRRGTSPPRADMRSFFDEVTALVEKSKALQGNIIDSSVNPRELSSLPPTDSTSQDDATATESPISQPKQTGRPSIFDMLPPPAKKRGPDAYEEEAFSQYSELLDTAMESPKFFRRHTKKPLTGAAAESVIAWLRAEEPVVRCNLPRLQRAMEGGVEPQHMRTGEKSTQEFDLCLPFRIELSEQQEKFMDHQGWTKRQYDIAVSVLANMGEMCAHRATGPPLDIAWQKLKEAGYKMDKNILHTYLYVSSTFSLRSARRLSSVRSVRSVLDFLDGIGSSGTSEYSQETIEPDEEKDKEDEGIHVAVEAAYVHDMLFEPTEQSTIIRVRALVSQGKAKEAEWLLDSSIVSDSTRFSFD
jgi:hypothetical protein